jgi:hypothetical protein
MNRTHTRSTQHHTGRRRIHLVAVAVAVNAVGMAMSGVASADTTNSACTEEFFGGNPGAEISFFAGPYFQDFNPGSGWHDNGDPLVPGRCNPAWAD